MKILAAALLSLAVSAAPAGAATFTAPRSLTGWGTNADFAVAAPGAAAWLQRGDVWLSRAGRTPVRLADGGAAQVRVATAPGSVTTAWVEDGGRIIRDDGDARFAVSGTMDRIRTLAATPAAIAWIGVSASNERKVQLATDDSARTPDQAGRPSFGIVGAGTARRALFVWHAAGGGPERRLQMLEVDGGHVAPARWITGPDGDATNPAIAMGPDGSAVLAWITGIPQGRIAVASIAPDGTVGEPQLVSAGPGGRPEAAIGADGTAIVTWAAQDGGGVEAVVRRPGEARFGAPTTFAPGASVTGWSTGVTGGGDAVVAWKDGETYERPRGGGLLHAAVARAGKPFGRPEVIEDHVFTLTGAGGALTWVEGRPEGAYDIDRRVRFASLLDDGAAAPDPGDPGDPGTPSDRAAPRLRLKLAGVRGRRVRVAVRSSERAALKATWKAGSRTLGRAGGTLRADRARVLVVKAPARARRVTLTVRATDAAGNAGTARKVVRIPRRS